LLRGLSVTAREEGDPGLLAIDARPALLIQPAQVRGDEQLRRTAGRAGVEPGDRRLECALRTQLWIVGE
jgi:hypothetical protein